MRCRTHGVKPQGIILALALCLAASVKASHAAVPRPGLASQQALLRDQLDTAAVDTTRHFATHQRSLLAGSSGSPGGIPQAILNAFNPATNPSAASNESGGGGVGHKPSGSVSAAAAAAPTFGASHYKQVLGLSYKFYEAQRSGALPAANRVKWRRSCHLKDRVVGGYLDAGDTIKHALTTAESVAFMAHAAIDFKQGLNTSGQLGYAKQAVKWGADYLAACHIGKDLFVGLIGDPGVDHAYWGRPEEYKGARRAYVWNRTSAASDLLGMTSAALASASILLRPDNAAHANLLLSKAKALYSWGAAAPGIYSSSFPGYPNVYTSNRYLDKLMLAAAWLARASSGQARTSYLAAAHKHYVAAGGRWQLSPYISYDSQFVPAASVLISLGNSIGASKVPGYAEYLDFYRNTFLKVWQEATGEWGIVSTPKGMRRASWSQWGNLRHSTNVAFFSLLYAKELPKGTPFRAACVKLAKSQVDYALGSAGRSFVVGWGTNPPMRVHHRAASCPDRPAPCNWDAFRNPGPNPQVLYGALVAGPKGPGDDTYEDRRDDYVSNEVAIDYNAGFTGALAGLLQVTP